MKFKHSVDPESLKPIVSLGDRVCKSIDGLRDAALKIVDKFSHGSIVLSWATKDEEGADHEVS